MDLDGGTKELGRRIIQGQNIFLGQLGQAARKKWSHLLHILPFKPQDDLQTWERFWLGNARSGCTFKIRRATIECDVGDGDHPWGQEFHGADQSYEKYAHVFWELRYLDHDIGTTKVKQRIRSGENIFRVKVWKAVFSKWGQLLNILPRPPADDIETWEYFHLKEVIDAVESGKQWSYAGRSSYVFNSPFDDDYYGAEKYGHLILRDPETGMKRIEPKTPPKDILRVTIQNALMRQAFNGRLSLALQSAPSSEDSSSLLKAHRQNMAYVWDRTFVNTGHEAARKDANEEDTRSPRAAPTELKLRRIGRKWRASRTEFPLI